MKHVSTTPLYKSSYLQHLSHIHNSIYGFDIQSQSLVQVDTKHSIVYPYRIQSASTNQILRCKYVEHYSTGQHNTKSSYFCVFDKKIQKYSFFDQNNQSGIIKNYDNSSNEFSKKKKCTLLTSNCMASFTGMFDAYHNSLIFVKLHENHGKYSINWLQGDNKQKKIVKLLDFNPKSVMLNRFHPQIVYCDQQNQVKYFDLAKPSAQTLLIKKSIILFDNQHLYSTSSNLVSKCNETYQIEVIDLKSGKKHFSFKGHHSPKKIQTFGANIFYMSEKGFFIYDKRKPQPIDYILLQGTKEERGSLINLGKEKSMNDFLIQPNLEKIYLSITNQLRMFDYNSN